MRPAFPKGPSPVLGLILFFFIPAVESELENLLDVNVRIAEPDVSRQYRLLS